MSEYPIKVTGWVLVIVYRYPSKTNPIIVNCYGFDTEKEARAEQRLVRAKAKKDGIEMDRIIALRVRPILSPDPQDVQDIQDMQSEGPDWQDGAL